MATLSELALPGNFSATGGPFEPPRPRFRRQRIVVFLAVFLPVLLTALAILFTRPAIYRAEARLEITPGTIAAPPATGVVVSTESNDRPFLTEIQNLTSRPLLADAVASLKKSGQLPEGLGADPVSRVQGMVSADAVDGTHIVALHADGEQQQFLPLLLNQLLASYQSRLEAEYKARATTADAGVGDEVRLLDEKVAAKRAEVDAFRARYDIVSMERDENVVLSQLKGLGAALNEANSRVAIAEGKLKGLRGAGAAGQATTRAKDDPTVADLEKRASQIQEDLKELGRKYTPQYLDMDPDVRAMRARLADLGQQIAAQRGAGQRSAIVSAQEDVASARETVARLKQQLEDGKQAAAQFSMRFAQYKALQEDLAQLEQLHRDALRHRAKLEASERESAPRMRILESATMPDAPWRPLYGLDAALSLAGALALGFFAVWLSEFFAVKPPREPALVIKQVLGAIPEMRGVAQGGAPAPVLAGGDPLPRIAAAAPHRDLARAEIRALFEAATDDGKIVVAALLTGLAPAELADLRWSDVDLAAGTVAVPGDSARTLALGEVLRDLLVRRRAGPEAADGPILRAPSGGTLGGSDIADLVLFAAYDSGLDRPGEVGPDAVRRAYVAFLIAQGIRLGDLPRIVGRIGPDELASHMEGGAPGARLPLDRIDLVFPGLQPTTPET